MSSQTADTTGRIEEEKYYLVLTGTLLDGYESGKVATALEHMLQIPRVQAYSLLQGKRSRIRKVLTKEKADRLQAKLVAAGAGCFIEPVNREPEPQERKAPMPAAEAEATDPSSGVDGDAEVNERLSLDLTPSDTPSLSDPSEMRVLSLELEPLAEAVSREMRAAAQSEDDTAGPMGVAEEGNRGSGDADSELPAGSGAKAMGEDPGRFFEQPNLRRQPVDDQGNRVISSRNRIFAAAGALLLLVVIGWASMGYLIGGDEAAEGAGEPAAESGPPPEPQQVLTEERMRSLGRSVKVWMIQYGFGFDPYQATLSRVQGDLKIPPVNIEDGWGTPLQYQPEQGGYSILSAGPDRKFGTPDDLKEKVNLE